ncbi:MAG: M56 family metallopeptidase [Planctomycetes bacterium]|nr:M56 family metallopeptidase [Planctomycetota bacterium]
MIWQTLSDPFVSRRLCLALLHSLWAVALLAMVAWLIDQRWRKLSVERSYALHVGALLLSLAVLPVTFAVVQVGGEDASVGGSPAVSPSITEAPLASSPQVHPLPMVDATSKQPPSTRLVSPTTKKPVAWNRIAPWLASIYAVGVLLMFGRLLVSIWRANRLESRATPISEGPLLECLQTLAGQWSLRVVPALARAEHVVVPKVVGLLKPTILFPTAALSGLSPDELEMILAHELAHVRRHDMWVNLLQRLAEVVLFFRRFGISAVALARCENTAAMR